MALHWLAPTNFAPSEPIYLYDNPSLHPINVAGIRIIQHGRKIRTVFGKVQDIDRLARTPEIGDQNNNEMAILYTQQNIPWQRRLDSSRLPNIENWWKNDSSSSPNGSLVYFNDVQKIIDNPNSNEFSVSFDPTDWTFQTCIKCEWAPEKLNSAFLGWFADCCAECGYCTRPGLVVDGQHRLRGMSRNPDQNNNHLELVFSTWLFNDDGFSRNKVAKIFTEVTSSAVELPKLHQEFLSAKYDLQPNYDPNTNQGRNRKRAYYIASQLNLSAGKLGNNDGRIEMIEKSRSFRGDVIDVARLTDYIAKWLENGGPFELLSDSDIIDAIENFISAAITVWDGKSYWSNDRHNIGALQTRGIFRMLLTILEKTSIRLQNSGFDLNTRNYISELEFIKPLNWALPEWGQVYTRQDSDQNITRKILQSIYDNAPNPPIQGQTISTDINQWMAQTPDLVEITSKAGSISNDSIEIQFSSNFPVINHKTVEYSWPQNAKGNATAIIELNGSIIDEFQFTGSLRKEISKIPSPTKLKKGDILEITIVHRSWDSKPRLTELSLTLT